MRVAAANLGYAGLGALHLGGYGLGITDTDVLKAGTVITFNVHSGTCSGLYERDIKDGLNNWAGQMIQINSVTTTWLGEVPTVLDVDVNATVKQDVTAGILRGQIIAALAAFNTSWAACTVTLTNNIINAAAGSTSSAATCPAGQTANAQGVCQAPDSGIPWQTIALYGGLAIAGTVILLLVVKR